MSWVAGLPWPPPEWVTTHSGNPGMATAVAIVVLMRVPLALLPQPARSHPSWLAHTPPGTPCSRDCDQPSRSVAVTPVENGWREGGPGPRT